MIEQNKDILIPPCGLRRNFMDFTLYSILNDDAYQEEIDPEKKSTYISVNMLMQATQLCRTQACRLHFAYYV